MIKYTEKLLKFILVLALFFLVFPQKSFAESETKLLLTFTDIIDPKPTNDYVNYYLYNPISKEEKHLTRMLSQIYPTGVMSNNNKNLYTNGVNVVSGKTYVQLFRHSLSPESKSMLTNNKDIWNVDHMRINNNESKVYMRVLQPNHFNSQLATYDIQSKQTTVWSKQTTETEIHNFDYSPVNNQLIVLEFSPSEEMSNIENANRQQQPIEPLTYHVVLYDSSGNKIREVTTIKKHILDISFSPDAKNVLFTTTNYNAGSKHTVYSLNIESKEVQELFSDSEDYIKIKQAQYSPDGKKIYFLTIKRDSPVLAGVEGRRVRPRILAAYDVESKKITEVWKKEKGTINNFLILR